MATFQTASDVVGALNVKLVEHLEDIQSFSVICDFMEHYIENALPMMTALFHFSCSPSGKCNGLICIDWLLNLSPSTIEIVNKEIIDYVKDLLEDRKGIPGVLYSGTMMKLLAKWKTVLNESIYSDLKDIMDFKVKSGSEITNLQLLVNILDQDRERWKKFKEMEWCLPNDTELNEYMKQPTILPETNELYCKERDCYFKKRMIK